MSLSKMLTVFLRVPQYSGVARSQTTPGHCTRLLYYLFSESAEEEGEGLGACSPSKLLHLKLRLHVTIFVSRFSLSRLGIRMQCVYTRGVKLAYV